MSKFTERWSKINRHRVRVGDFKTTDADGFNGAFFMTVRGAKLKIIISDGEGWKHVSVSLAQFPNHTPSWEAMCEVKDLFFEPEDCVVQFHPPKSRYVNTHPGCLHLWQSLNEKQPVPPQEMV